VSAAAGLIAVSLGSNEVNVYELATMKLRSHYGFPVEWHLRDFPAMAEELFVLTRDQTAYVLDPSASLPAVATSELAK
jgi:hypothetical protein